MPTALDIITAALTEIRVLTSPGQTPAPTHVTYALAKLNRMIGVWNTRSLIMWKTEATQYDLVSGQQTYTLGRSGTPDWVGDRPTGTGPGYGIQSAVVLLPGTNPSATRVPVWIMSSADWAARTLESIPTWPTIGLYNENGTPNTTIHLWGTPTQNGHIELTTEKQVTEFSATSDSFNWPPAYYELAVCELAYAMFPQFGGGGDAPATLNENLRRARAAVQSINSASPKLRNDAPSNTPMVGSDWDYRTGLPPWRGY